jgi:hypothetical protein
MQIIPAEPTIKAIQSRGALKKRVRSNVSAQDCFREIKELLAQLVVQRKGNREDS